MQNAVSGGVLPGVPVHFCKSESLQNVRCAAEGFGGPVTVCCMSSCAQSVQAEDLFHMSIRYWIRALNCVVLIVGLTYFPKK